VKKMQQKSGSMVLTTVFFISIFMLIMLMQWRSQEALQKVMIMRGEYIKRHYAAEALLEYGIDVCKKQYALITETVITERKPLILSFHRWPLGNESYAQGTIEIFYNAGLSVTATLSEHRKKQVSLSCLLAKQKIQNQDVYTIKAWKRNEIRDES
jgi:hypothetical protein